MYIPFSGRIGIWYIHALNGRHHEATFLFFSPFLFFFSCPSGGPVNVRADSDSESEQPILQSGARRRWQRRRADVDRREDATVLLDRDAVNEVKDGVQLHCIQCTINVHGCHDGEW